MPDPTTQAEDDRTPRERWFTYALDLERIPLDERLVRLSDVPADDPRRLTPCVYMHILDGQLMYVGQTVDPEYRRRTHAATREWDEEYVLLVPDDMLDWCCKSWLNSVESALIHHLNPPYNARHWNAGESTGHVFDHVRLRGFALPDGITVGRRHVPIVRGPCMAPATDPPAA
jgi:hypothetical protein